MMRIAATLALVGSATVVHADTAGMAQPVDPAAQARAIAAELGAGLKAELQAAMQAGGPANAITVCRDRALPVAIELGERTGWEVGRTSLKVRNPDNAPDSWERTVLTDFVKRAAAGEDVARLEQQVVITVGEHRYLRYMKAIPTGELCTVCHGTMIAPDVQAALQALYPDDRATGFRPGDLRGAFSLTRKLD